jgi:hypothetical protein
MTIHLKTVRLLLAALVCEGLGVSTARADFVVVDEGRANAVVMLGDNANVTQFAAKELVKYVKAMSGAELPIVADGDCGTTNALRIVTTKPGLRRDEIVLGVDKDSHVLELTGDGPRGGLNAVYELLERWGVRYFTPEREKIPQSSTLSLPDGFSYAYASPFEWRKPGSIPLDRNIGPAWAVKLRVSREYSNKNYGGKRDSDIGSGHSLGNKSFVDVKKHFAEHPEWYALRGGKRVTDGQLCHSSEGMRAQLLDEIRKKAAGLKGRISANAVYYVSLSYLDNNKFCTCGECKKLRDRWGGAPIGPALDIANFVAKELENDYPGLRIKTLAYWDWVEPPSTTPEPLHTNVYVTICQNGNKALPLARQKNLMERLQKWNALAPGRLLIWDWDACFRNYLTPYPTYHLYAEDFRTYRNLGVRQVLSQLPHGAVFADFVDMRTYLYAKLAWNPDLDGEAIAKEWIDFCCGKGADAIWDYYLLVARALWGADYARHETRANLHGYNPGRGWLSADDLATAYQLFEKALSATADDPKSHATVRCLSAGMLELVIERYEEVLAALRKRGDSFAMPKRLELVDRFEAIGKDFYSWCYREGPQPRNFASLVKMLREGTLQ